MSRWLKLLALGVVALSASACSHMPEIGSVLPDGANEVSADASPRERVRTAIQLLGDGHERRARGELSAALREQPGLSSARRLLDQIEQEPAALLAGPAQNYTVRAGETMSQLAERFQGDALLFYALARYNNIAAPNQVSAGQVIRIPRRPGVRAGVTTAALTPSGAPEPTAGAATPPQLRAAATAVAPTNASRSPQAARANELRRLGLQHLNSGQVDRAVATLRQAQALDGSNEAIRRDLDRATRLQASLRTENGTR